MVANGKSGLLSGLMKRLHDPVYTARLRELVRQITPHLRPGDRVLDVGSGTGALGRAILEGPQCPPAVAIQGLERVRRGHEAIPTEVYDGRTIPHADASFDVVLLADMLHHEPDPHWLIEECVRVSRRLLVIKDHKVEGPWARRRLELMDWAANAPYGVPCLYRYNTAEQWTEWYGRHRLAVEAELNSMRLYPPMYNLIFGNKLQYLAVLRVPDAQPKPDIDDDREGSAGRLPD